MSSGEARRVAVVRETSIERATFGFQIGEGPEIKFRAVQRPTKS